jgi:hypothetical protein
MQPAARYLPKDDLMSVHVLIRTAAPAPAATSIVQQACCRNSVGGRHLLHGCTVIFEDNGQTMTVSMRLTTTTTLHSTYDAQEHVSETNVAGRDRNRSEPIETFAITWKKLWKYFTVAQYGPLFLSRPAPDEACNACTAKCDN